LATFSGCAIRQGYLWNPLQQAAPCSLTANATVTDVINHLNANTTKVYSWQSTDTKIRARGNPISLSAKLAVESPRNFRLMVSSPTGREVDLGSNAERFWFWARRSEVKHVFHARHDQMRMAQKRLQIPFNTGWLMEALGVVPLLESDWTLTPALSESPTLQLVSERVSTEGVSVRQMMTVDACYGYVLEQSLYDASGRMIAQATMSDHQLCPNSDVTLPHRIELSWPQAEIALTMTFRTIQVNPTDFPEQLWTMPEIADSPPLDVGQRTLRPGLAANEADTSGRVRLRPISAQQPAAENPFRKTSANTCREPYPWEVTQ